MIDDRDVTNDFIDISTQNAFPFGQYHGLVERLDDGWNDNLRMSFLKVQKWNKAV